VSFYGINHGAPPTSKNKTGNEHHLITCQHPKTGGWMKQSCISVQPRGDGFKGFKEKKGSMKIANLWKNPNPPFLPVSQNLGGPPDSTKKNSGSTPNGAIPKVLVSSFSHTSEPTDLCSR